MKKTDDNAAVKNGSEDHKKKISPSDEALVTPMDADEKVHGDYSPEVNMNEEQDYDDVVHQMPQGRDSTNDEDLDDKVHLADDTDKSERS